MSERALRFSPPSLRGRHVELRGIVPEDMTYLQLLETSSALAPRWRLRGATPGPQEWAQGLWRGVLAQFIVLRTRDQARIGLVAAYQANAQDGYAYIAATRFDPDGRSPHLILGVTRFIDYVFDCWSFRKLYMEIPEYNYPQIASGQGRIFELEGRLRQHSYLGGELWDMFTLAIYKDKWRARRPRLSGIERAEP